MVGAGAAGSVIAARLTEDPAQEVLLVESGPDYPDPALLPRDLAHGYRNSLRRHDWKLRHRPTSQQVRFPLPRGRVVGGSSAVNTCIALRGQPEDYDEWAARGLPEWTWEACLPAFRRLERDLDFPDAPFHGDAGPLPLQRPPPSSWVTWQAAFVEACREVGFPDAPDTNAPGAAGVGPHAFNRIGTRRISAAEAWLTPEVRARPGLRIAAETHVVRVETTAGRATGVTVRHQGQLVRVEARRVVLCAGAIHTPGVLLRSGIGPRADLDRLAIPVVRDLPAVGARLLDHPGSAIMLTPRWGVAGPDDPVLQTVLRYPGSGAPWGPDMLLQPGSGMAFRTPVVPLVSIMGHVGKPRGTGHIRWTSADPDARPEITSLLLEDPADRRLAVDNMQLAGQLTQTRAMRGLARQVWPAPGVLRDRARTDAWIRRSTDSGYHPCGTVPMGAEDDPDAATDGRGRVRGVEGLVVADASLMPTVPSSNTHLPTLMIGERVGAWLREDTA
ncbi:MAG: GMC family oxidoreductase N-terminal domain-containing protein [Alphaproteobacteria bacterium]|nr:GMC family oxidoreductase N-terminal domain-containing protein [Alphaproteobacteria bacterium]